jgi:hypothetical protein
MGQTVQVAKDRASNLKETVYPSEVARGVFMQNPPSLRALKLMHLMISKAGGRMADDVRHDVRLSEICAIDGMSLHDRKTIQPLFEELRAAVMTYDEPDAKRCTIGGLLDQAVIDYRDEVSGDILISWYFGRMFRDMAAKSNHWAILDRQTVFHLGSKYSVLLFQHIASLINLKYVTSKSFTVPELRAVFGIPEGRVKRFADLRKDVLFPAIEDINKQSRFILTTKLIKRGRTVSHVEIAWTVKSDNETTEVKHEHDRHSAGRKARQKGTVETIEVCGFPSHGGISFSSWGDIARQTLPQPAPDVDTVAEQFRGWCVYKGISLDAKTIEKTFRGFCKNYGK